MTYSQSSKQDGFMNSAIAKTGPRSNNKYAQNLAAFARKPGAGGSGRTKAPEKKPKAKKPPAQEIRRFLACGKEVKRETMNYGIWDYLCINEPHHRVLPQVSIPKLEVRFRMDSLTVAVQQITDYSGVEVSASGSFRVPDRDKPEEMRTLYYSLPSKLFRPDSTEEEKKMWLLEQVMEVVKHEVFESIYIDGERSFDPHGTDERFRITKSIKL